MILEGMHEKDIFKNNYPFRLEFNNETQFTYPSHWHSAVELVYVLQNNYAVDVSAKQYCLSERDILIIAPGDIHSINTRNNVGRRVYIQFDLSLLEGFGGIHPFKPFLAYTRKLSAKDFPQLHKDLEEKLLNIIDEYENKKFAYELSINARIFDILVVLSRNLSDILNNEAPSPGTKRIDGLDKLQRALKFIEENYQNSITLYEVAKEAGFSEYHFSRIFKDITGKNFLYYLNEYRIKKAEQLLANSGSTIAQIAHNSGFNSIVTFNRIFREIKGCTPTMYKKMGI